MQSFSGESSNQSGPFASCSNCGLANPPQAKFCARCGHSLIQQAAPSSREMSARGPIEPLLSPNRGMPASPPLAQVKTTHRQESSLTKQSPLASPQRFPANLIEFWWVRFPVTLRRSWPLFSEVWRDGIYLTAVPRAALLLPIALFLFGALEGFTHWAPVLNPPGNDGLAVSFTELLPFMILATAAGALSANLGLMITSGYALGDLVNTALAPQSSFPSDFTNTPLVTLWNLYYLYTPHLVSYLVLGLLAMTPTLTARVLTLRLHRLIRSQLLRAFLQTALGACIIGVVIFGWTQAAPVLIRVYWGWGWYSIAPPLAGMFYLQQPVTSGLIIGVGMLAFVVRGVLMYPATWNRNAGQYTARLLRGLTRADAHPTWLRRLPSFTGTLVPAIVTTLLLGGLIASPWELPIMFLFFWLLLVVRGTILPRLTFWATWTRLLKYVPVIARLTVALFLTTISAMLLVNALWLQVQVTDTPSSTFVPLLLTTGVASVIITILLPEAKQVPPARMPRQARSVVNPV